MVISTLLQSSLLWVLLQRACSQQPSPPNPGGEKTPPVDDVTWTTAFLLIGSVVISVGILYLVNCHDVQIRKAAWTLLSTTLSIFSATTFDFGIERLISFAVEEHSWVSEFCFSCFALVFFVLLHITLLRVNKDDHHKLLGVKTLGGHIYAFAALVFFGHLQHWKLGWTPWVFIVPVLALFLMICAYLVMLGVAIRCQRDLLTEKSLQVHHAMEMQIEASAITVGFLLIQALCFSMSLADDWHDMFMPITHGSPGQHRPFTVPILSALAFGLLIFSSVWSIRLRQICDFHHFSDFVGQLSSVTACWCFQRAGVIFLYGLIQHRMDWYLKEKTCQHLKCDGSIHMEAAQVTHRAQIVNAFLMSVFAVVLLWLIGSLANQIEECKDPTKSHLLLEQAESSLDLDLDAVAKGLRLAMSGLGVLVGICWDKAFETAYATVLEERSMNSLVEEFKVVHKAVAENPKTAQAIIVVLGLILFCFVAIAWYSFILPHAMKEEEAQGEDIHTQQESYSKSLALSLALEEAESSSVTESE